MFIKGKINVNIQLVLSLAFWFVNLKSLVAPSRLVAY